MLKLQLCGPGNLRSRIALGWVYHWPSLLGMMVESSVSLWTMKALPSEYMSLDVLTNFLERPLSGRWNTNVSERPLSTSSWSLPGVDQDWILSMVMEVLEGLAVSSGYIWQELWCLGGALPACTLLKWVLDWSVLPDPGGVLTLEALRRVRVVLCLSFEPTLCLSEVLNCCGILCLFGVWHLVGVKDLMECGTWRGWRKMTEVMFWNKRNMSRCWLNQTHLHKIGPTIHALQPQNLWLIIWAGSTATIPRGLWVEGASAQSVPYLFRPSSSSSNWSTNDSAQGEGEHSSWLPENNFPQGEGGAHHGNCRKIFPQGIRSTRRSPYLSTSPRELETDLLNSWQYLHNSRGLPLL